MSSFSDVGGTDRSKNEGKITSEIEKRTANVPSIVFLGLAGASVVGSLTLMLLDKKEVSTFVGQWAPTFLILGLYNKLVKEMETPKPISSGLSRH